MLLPANNAFEKAGPWDCPRATRSKGIVQGTASREVNLISVQGLWANCDLWLSATQQWWVAGVVVRVYGYVGVAETLLEEVALAALATPPTAAARMQARVAIARGAPCYGYRVTVNSGAAIIGAEGSPEQGLQAELVTWGAETAPEGTSVLSSTYGNATAGAAASQLSSSPSPRPTGLLIKALSTNTESVFYGSSAAVAVASGMELEPGEAHFIPVADPSRIWSISASGGQSIRWTSY